MHEVLAEKNEKRKSFALSNSFICIIQHVWNYWFACGFVTFSCAFFFRVPLSSPNPAHVPGRTWKLYIGKVSKIEPWEKKNQHCLCALELFWQHFKSERILVEEVLWVLRIEKREFFRFYSFSEEKLIFFFAFFGSWPWKAEKSF